MRTMIVSYVSVLAVFLVLDVIWLGFVAGPFYREALGPLLKPEFDIAVAGAFYLFYVVGLVFFAVQPAHASGSVWTAVFYGAFLGALCYATYDLTNLATLKGYPVSVAVVDIAWGMVISGASAGGGYLITRRIDNFFA